MIEQEELWSSDEDLEETGEIRLTGGQYDLLAIDAPEKKRVKPATELVFQLQPLFPGASDRQLYMTANKVMSRVGLDLALKGLNYLLKIPGWADYIAKNNISPITLVTRIEQAAALADEEKREVEVIVLELKRLKAKRESTIQRVVNFYQAIHSSHPTIRKQIKLAAEQLLQAAHRIDKDDWLDLAIEACEIAWRDKEWRTRQIKQARVPADTTKKVIQVMVHRHENK